MRVEGKAVRKRFGRIEALRGIDFTIPSGGRIGLIGPPDRDEIVRLAICLEERGADPVILDPRLDPGILGACYANTLLVH